MGQYIPSLHHQSNSHVSEEIEYSREIDDPFFGLVQVYRRLVPPFDYIMRHQHLFQEGQAKKLEEFSTNMKILLKIKHPNLAQIHTLNFSQEKLMCVTGTKVSVYWDYYNYTLRHCAAKRMTMSALFTESELIYIFDCLVSVASILKDQGIVLGDWRSDRLFLTPEGRIRIYLPQIQRENQHAVSYRSLIDKQVVQQSILSPQQLYFISRMEQQPSDNIYRSEVFAIGIVMLELVSLSDFKQYYQQQRAQVDTQNIKDDLKKASQKYSAQLINLIDFCLQEQPSDRITIQKAHERLQALKEGLLQQSDCIRLRVAHPSKNKGEVFAEIKQNQWQKLSVKNNKKSAQADTARKYSMSTKSTFFSTASKQERD